MLLPGQEKGSEVTQNQRLPRGSTVATAEQSFVRLILRDNSTVNVGPASRMEMVDTPKGEAGMLNLLNGQIRAKVTKDVLKEGEEAHDKLRVQTKSAAMGVRGTDFLVAFNQSNNVTSLLTFEGKVAMAKMEPGAVAAQVLRSEKVVFVTEGKLSTINAAAPAPSEPVKLSPIQFEQLKSNQSMVPDAKSDAKADPKKASIPPVPPLVNAASFVSKPDMIAGVAPAGGDAGKGAPPPKDGAPPAFRGTETVTAGAILDLRSGIAISPPPGSIPDPVTGVLVPPANLLQTDRSGSPILADGLKIGQGGVEVDKAKMAALPADHAQVLQMVAVALNANTSTAKSDAVVANGGNAPPPPPPSAAQPVNIAWVVGAATMAQNQPAATGGNATDAFKNLGMGAPPPGLPPPATAAGGAPPPGTPGAPGAPGSAAGTATNAPPPPPEYADTHQPPPPTACDSQCHNDQVKTNLPPSTTVRFNITVGQ